MKHQKPLSEENAAALVSAFLDGTTSPAEEESLYAFFRSAPEGSLPPEMESVRPMFAWFENLKPQTERPKVSFWHRFRYAGVAAAVAAAVAGSSILFKDSMHAENPLYAQYAGSYVIRDGQRISDMNLIYNDIVEAERLADSIENAAYRQADMMEHDYDRMIVELALSNVSDASLARELEDELLVNE